MCTLFPQVMHFIASLILFAAQVRWRYSGLWQLRQDWQSLHRY
jgi:hypothetical protein